MSQIIDGNIFLFLPAEIADKVERAIQRAVASMEEMQAVLPDPAQRNIDYFWLTDTVIVHTPEQLAELGKIRTPDTIICNRETIEAAVHYVDSNYAFTTTRLIALCLPNDLKRPFIGRMDAHLPALSAEELVKFIGMQIAEKERNKALDSLVQKVCMHNPPYQDFYQQSTGQTGSILVLARRPYSFLKPFLNDMKFFLFEVQTPHPDSLGAWTAPELQRFDIVILDETLIRAQHKAALRALIQHAKQILSFNPAYPDRLSPDINFDPLLYNQSTVFRIAAFIRRQQLRQTLNNIGENLEESRRLADHDPLTELGNRRRLNAYCREVHKLGQLQYAPYVIIDLDYFKMINDTYGHAAGDQALVTAAQVFKSCARTHPEEVPEENRLPVPEGLMNEYGTIDYVARFGGEEFALVVYDNNIETAQNILRRARAALENISLEVPVTEDNFTQILNHLTERNLVEQTDNKNWVVTKEIRKPPYYHLKGLKKTDEGYLAILRVTFSAGITVLNLSNPDLAAEEAAASTRADRALYAAKARRNHDVTWSEEMAGTYDLSARKRKIIIRP